MPARYEEATKKQYFAVLIGGPADGRAMPAPPGREEIRIPIPRDLTTLVADEHGTYDPVQLSDGFQCYTYRHVQMGGLPPSRAQFYVYTGYLDDPTRKY